MLNISIKIRLAIDPSATVSYLAGFLLVGAYIWRQQRRQKVWNAK